MADVVVDVAADGSPTVVARKPYTALDFVADQLRAANFGGDWDSQGIDRARELGAILLRNGIIDLSKLGAVKLTVSVREFPWADPVDQTQIALMYEGRQIGYLGTPDEPAREPWLQNYVLLAWSSAGHGNVSYICRFSPQGFVIVPQWGSSSDWGTFREIVRMFVTLWLMYLSAGTASGAGGGVGATVMGAGFAAAYPALTAIVGNIAIGAYFSGGNVKNAVRGALLSYAGGSLGDMAGSVTYTATQIEILGVLADAAVTALVRGRDMETAVTESLLRYGFSSVGEMMAATGETQMLEIDTSGYPIDGDPYSPGTVDAYGPGSGWGQDVVSVSPDESFNAGGFFNLGNTGAQLEPVTFDPGAPAAGFQVPTFTATGERVSPPIRSTDGGSMVNMVNSLSALAMNGLQLTRAWNQANNPQPNTQARSVTAGAVVSGNDAGVIITRRADGSVSTARPPVGVPQATTTGNFIVNNGDNTYTLVGPDGSRRVVAYGENAGPEKSALPWPLLIAGAGLAISILK